LARAAQLVALRIHLEVVERHHHGTHHLSALRGARALLVASTFMSASTFSLIAVS
jgi:hypothetical protein